MLMSLNRRTLLRVPVDGYKTEEFLLKVEQSLSNQHVRTIFAVNPEKIMRAQRDPELLSALIDADFLIPDGIGTVLGILLIYGEIIPRTTGIGLMGRLLDLGEKNRYRVFVFGSAPEIVEQASRKIMATHPLLGLVGTQHGYLQNEEYGALVDKINELQTDLLFVGLGSPMQEKWIQKYKTLLKVKLCMGIGGSLDIIAGRNSRTPLCFQYLGLEWFYRLIREPRRLGRQMNLPRFVIEILKAKIPG
jgi:N-acetylglucosaminyldiphosphoundecaprenol N-acetyl-beta-D-mannosaminyltransferase